MSEKILKDILKVLEQIRDRILVKEETPKIEMGKVYNYMKKDGTPLTCDKCGGLISWDDRPQRVYPMHVDKEGHILGTGDCPKFGGS